MNAEHHHQSHLRTWIWIAVMLSIIAGKGLFSFFVVGDLGQPNWDYRTVKDVPAQSAYAKYQLLPHPQHVRGARGE